MKITGNLLKRVAVCALSAVLILSVLLMSGCSTSKHAGTVNGEKITTGEYLAFLYYSFMLVDNQYYLSYYGTENMWAQSIPYGDGEDVITLPADEYVVRNTRDIIARQIAVEAMMTEYGITVPQESIDEFETSIANMPENDILRMGINKVSYAAAFRKLLNESALFNGLFGADGKTPMTEDEIAKYYNDNYTTYKIISLPLVDENDADLSEEDLKAVKDRMAGYLEMYKSDEEYSFDKIINKFAEDEKAAGEETEEHKHSPDCEHEEDGTEDPAVEETVITAEDAKANIKFIDVAAASDEALTNAVREVGVGEVQIKEYKAQGTKKTIALILRVDPATTEDYAMENSRQSIIENAKYEGFNKEITEKANAVEVKIDAAILKKCTPRQLIWDMENR